MCITFTTTAAIVITAIITTMMSFGDIFSIAQAMYQWMAG
jgi:hypothetical protein